MTKDKPLRGVRLKKVLQKRRLDQALNMKEFALGAGVSYSTAREWFRMPGFPVMRRMVFWQDFVQWRTTQNGTNRIPTERQQPFSDISNWTPRTQRLMMEIRTRPKKSARSAVSA